MRTTVNIDEDLLARAREQAARTRRTLGEVVDDALRVALSATGASTDRTRVDLPTYGGSGLRPGVDLEDKDRLAAVLDDDEDGHAAG